MADARTMPGHQKRRLKIATKRFEHDKEEAEKQRERARILLTETGGAIEGENDIERTWKAKQKDILEDADDNTRAKVLDLKLGSRYSLKYTKNGRFMIMGGDKGHLAVVDALRAYVKVEVNLENEVVHDVAPMHNETLFAAAQNKYVYIYDHSGTEVHQLRSHIEPRRLEFLPYHYLLASVGRSSRIVYQDVSTGALVASLRSRMGPCAVLAQNRKTAVLATGHANGVVAMWAPTNGDALVKVLCHPAPITAVSFDRTGKHMVTAGLDGKVAIWDVRNLGTRLNAYQIRGAKVPTCLDVSDTGLVAVGTSGDEVSIWKDVFGEEKQKEAYLFHRLPSGQAARCVSFRPFEDVLGIGYSSGVQTIIVPGAGEANYDAFEANPFERKVQRRETEVRGLLDKLPADTIGLGQIGAVFMEGTEKAETYLDKLMAKAKKRKNKQRPADSEKLSEDANDEEGSLVLGNEPQAPTQEREEKIKKKMKGRGKIGSKLKSRHRNIITIEREKSRMAQEEERSTKKRSAVESVSKGAVEPGQLALNRFKKQKRVPPSQA